MHGEKGLPIMTTTYSLIVITPETSKYNLYNADNWSYQAVMKFLWGFRVHGLCPAQGLASTCLGRVLVGFYGCPMESMREWDQGSIVKGGVTWVIVKPFQSLKAQM